MKILKTTLVSCILFTSNSYAVHIIDVQKNYDIINAQTLQFAADAAMDYRKEHINTDVIIQLAEGTYELDTEIAFSNFDNKGEGWIKLQGAGRDKTHLIDTEYTLEKSMTFRFDHAYKFKISDMTIEGERLTTSQGTIVSTNSHTLNIKLDDGYPTPNTMYEIDTSKANKIRRILDSDLHPVAHYIEDPSDNDHQSQRWTFQGDYDRHGDAAQRPVLVSGRTWKFYLQDIKNTHPFQVGDRVGVSSKSKRSNWAVFTGGGQDVSVENIDFLKLGRVKFRQEWHNLRYVNNRILRPIVNGKPAFYSTDAGPQVGHEKDGVDIYNLVFENNDFRATVDDASALQRIASGSIKNNYWEDGGGVPLGVSSSASVAIENNTFYHCPLEDLRPGKTHFKGAYKPTILKDNTLHSGLSWSSGSRTDYHEVRIGTSNPPSTVIENQTQNQYQFSCTLKANTTYYWQVFEHNIQDSLGVNKSDVWTFTTGNNVKNNGETCSFSQTVPNKIPDYIPTLNAVGTIITKSGDIDLLVRIAEVNDASNFEGDLSFSIVKNSNLTLTFNSEEKNRQGKNVENVLWTMEEKANFYLFTYKGHNRIFPKLSTSYIGMMATFTASDKSKGQFNFDVTVLKGTGETINKNNRDGEIVQYNNL